MRSSSRSKTRNSSDLNPLRNLSISVINNTDVTEGMRAQHARSHSLALTRKYTLHKWEGSFKTSLGINKQNPSISLANRPVQLYKRVGD